MATRSGILAWEIPWTEEPGGLQSMGSQRVRNNLATKQQQQTKHLFHPLEGGMATHSSIHAWRIPWTEEPDQLQSMGSQRVRYD